MGMSLRSFAWLAAATLLAASGGCQQRTEIMVGVITNIEAPNAVDEVQLSGYRDGIRDAAHTVLSFPWEIPGQGSLPYTLPGSFGVYSPDGSATRVELVLSGNKNGKKVVERTALVSLVPGKTLFMRMGLVITCMGKFDCGPTQTCIEGVCKESTVDSRILPDYAAELVDHVTCGDTPFIDTGSKKVVQPLANEVPCEGPCVEGTCYKAIPPEWATQATPASSAINAIWGPSTGTDVFAVGDKGTIIHLPLANASGDTGSGAQATAWLDESTGSANLHGVFGFDANNVWAVGDNSTVLRRTSSGWVPETTPPGMTLESIWGSAPTDLWAVGSDAAGKAVVLHGGGGGWGQDLTYPGLPALHGITGIAQNMMVVVGDGGSLFSTGGHGWMQQSAPVEPTTNFLSAFVVGTDGYVVGTGGTILHVLFNGSMTVERSGVSSRLTSVWFSAPNDVYAVGDGGVILHSTGGGDWARQSSNTTNDILAVWGSSSNRVYAVGQGATVLYSMGTQQTSGGNQNDGGIGGACGGSGQSCCKTGVACVSGFTCSPDTNTCVSDACGVPGAPCCAPGQNCGAGLLCDQMTQQCVPLDLTGAWSGTFIGGSNGNIDLTLYECGTAVTGIGTINAGACTGGSSVSGETRLTLVDNVLDGSLFSGTFNATPFTITGNALVSSSTQLSGTTAASAIATCGTSNGTFAINRVGTQPPPVVCAGGRWNGTWTLPTGSGVVGVDLVQSARDSATGGINFNGTLCFTAGTTTWTFPDVSGKTFTLASDVGLAGQMTLAGTHASGTFTIASGDCMGQSITLSLDRQ